MHIIPDYLSLVKQKAQAQFKKQAAMDDDDPNAYKPAVGDKTAKTRMSTHTAKMRKMYPDVYEASKSDKSLAKKAKASGMPLGILRQVYNRGVAAWKNWS